MPTVDLDISIVNHSNPDMLLACLRSLFATTRRAITVWVIDNATDGRLVPEIQAEFPQVRWLFNEQRQGFSANHNQMLSRSTARHALILNDDTIIHENAIDGLIEFLDNNPAVGMAGPRLLNPNGTIQDSTFRFMTCFSELISHTQLPRFLCHLKTKYIDPAQWGDQTADVDWVLGACLIVRGQTLKQVGLLDSELSPIANTEEVDWCYRANKRGWMVAFVPSVKITHIGGQSLKPDENAPPTADPMRVEMFRTRLAFFQKHYGLISTLALRAIYVGTLPINTLMFWQSAVRGRFSVRSCKQNTATIRAIAWQALKPVSAPLGCSKESVSKNS